MKESEIQSAIMSMLLLNPNVAWAYVTSAGIVRGSSGGRPFKIGFNGLSDIIGQMRDGRLLAIEVKRPGQNPRKDQFEFLKMVAENNGVSGCCDSVGAAEWIINSANSK